MDGKGRILFVSAGNAARSPMAEVLMRHHAGDRFEVFSAGIRPQPIDPRAVQALQQLDFDCTELASKPVSEFAGLSFDYVICLNDLSPPEWQLLPPARECLVWHFPDPQLEEQRHTGAFARCLQELNERINMFLLIVAKRH